MKMGIPKIDDYICLKKDTDFMKLESFSIEFYRRNEPYLKQYMKKWFFNPMISWSRRWEYTFVYKHLKSLNGGKILDAGSGISFFPYFIKRTLKLDVVCYDTDRTLSGIFEDVNKNEGLNVQFRLGSISNTDFEDESFDAIYCISVLEHLHHRDRLKSIDEFNRILKRGGKLMLTFDISLDGSANVPINESDEIYNYLNRVFKPLESLPPDYIKSIKKSTDILTTKFIKCYNRNLLPWKYPLLSSLIKPILQGKLPRGFIKNITVFCGVYEKA